MIESKSRSGSVAVGVLKALHLLNAESKPATLEAVCNWLATSEDFYYDDWLIVGGRTAAEYIADILEDLRELGVVCTVERDRGANSQTSPEWRAILRPCSLRLPGTKTDGNLLMLIWAPTRKSLDGRGTHPGTTKKIEIEELSDGSFLMMRYESVEESVPTSDHWYESLEEVYDECERVYGIARDEWRQR